MLPHSHSAASTSTVSSDFIVQAITIPYVKYKFSWTIERYIHYVQNQKPEMNLEKHVPNKEPLERKLYFIYVFLTDCVVKESGCQTVQNIFE